MKLNSRKIRKSIGGVLCPVTRGMKTGFMSIPAYEEVCEKCKVGMCNTWRSKSPTLYQSICGGCPNAKKKKKMMLHGAYLLPAKTVAEVYEKHSR